MLFHEIYGHCFEDKDIKIDLHYYDGMDSQRVVESAQLWKIALEGIVDK
jgi:hypothetical protein